MIKPDCFGYFDGKDPSCRSRCKLKGECAEEQARTRPTCFGEQWDEKSEECMACLDASACADGMSKEDMEMTKRRRVKMRKRPVKPVEPEPEEVEEVEVEVEVEEDAQDYTEMSVADLRAECEERELDAAGRKSALIRRLMQDDGEEVEEEEEPAPKPTPKVKRRTVKRKPEPKKVVEAAEKEEEAIGSKFSFDGLIAAMAEGSSLVVARTTDGYTVSLGGVTATAQEAAPKSKGLRGDPFWREVLTQEYYDFTKVDAGEGKPWEKMTREEKFKFADDLGVEWEEQEDERVEFIGMCRAIFEELGIVKYKPEYKSAAARKALK